MITLHALWTNGTLHVWGDRIGTSTESDGLDNSNGQKPYGYPTAVGSNVLRSILGDTFDSLLVSGSTDEQLTLRLPPRSESLVPAPPAPKVTYGEEAQLVTATAIQTTATQSLLVEYRVPTLAFSASDAFDLLTASPTFSEGAVQQGASLRYWSHAGRFVLELLARQHFIPAIHAMRGDQFRGYWRVILDEDGSFDRVSKLIASMPPVCRSIVTEDEPEQASFLLENFLRQTVDTMVRRCLEGDELANAIHEQSTANASPQMLWLRSLVERDGRLDGTPEEGRHIYDTIVKWVSRLESIGGERTCKTCFRLHGPSSGLPAADKPWKLTLHAQAIHQPELVVDVAQLLGHSGNEPPILKRPFDRAWEQIHADIVQAARFFPPLESCVNPSEASQCALTLEEAYSFLRDAAPILESEGFGVWMPDWWQRDRPRLRMWLDIKPSASVGSSSHSTIGLDALVQHDWRLAIGEEDLTPEEITQLAETVAPLVQVRGRWTEVQSTELKTALRYLNDHPGGTMTVFEALRQCYIADDLETGVPVAGLRSTGWIEEFLGASQKHQTVEQLDPPAGFNGTLRPYQQRGMEWLVFLSRLGLGACLADDMGLGKTIQMIAVWLHEREKGASPGPTLLVVPMSLVGNWQREIEHFAPTLKVMVHHGLERLTGQEFVNRVHHCDVVISTYGLIHRDLEHVAAVEWYRVTLDEAQNIKNPAAKQAQAIRSLRSVHRVALTGTPVENRLSELWSILDFLNVGYLGSAAEFRRRFAVPIERHHDNDRAQRLRHLIRPLILRRLKNDPSIEVDLPDKMEMKVYCNLTREQAGLYEATVNEMMRQIDNSGGIQRRGLILATLVRLKQICNHPAQFLADGSPIPHRSGKCDRLTEMLEEVLAEGDSAIIFTQFRQMGKLITKHLQEVFDREILFLHGGSSRKSRDDMVQQFQDPEANAPLFILSLKAGGYGLNLTAASHVFHFDRWWNPAVEDQATDRAHRIGQFKRVQVHKFVCVGTLEEKIDKLLEEKRDLADNVVGSGEQWLTELSTENLRTLFGLSRDAVAED